MNADELSIIEIFNSFQGEGRSMGMPSVFLRLAYCNLQCVWCDTKYSWDWKNYDPKQEIHDMPVREVADAITQWRHTPNLVITGGEPMLQQTSLVELDRYLHEHTLKTPPFSHVEIETAGTIQPTDALISRVSLFNVSPKLENSGNSAMRRYKEVALQQFADLAGYNKAIFKFVVSANEDYPEIDAMVAAFKIPKFAVYIMPEGITEEAIKGHAQLITQGAMDRGYRLTTRLHVLLYGNKRGV